MKGTIVANNAAIVLGTGVSIEGRAMSTTGAVTVNGVTVRTPVGCGSPLLTGPAAPALGSVACYTLFASTGQVSNTGVSYVVGDIGTNGGLTTGFDDLNVTGTVHDNPDTSTAQAAADLGVLYNSLNAMAHDIQLLYPAQLGNDLVLTPHTYLLDAETVLTNNLILDAQDNANAVFVIKITGALTTSTYAKILLINGAQAKNVFWKVTGAVNLNDYVEFKGTLVNSGALILNTGTIIAGRAMTINGSLTTMSVNATMTPGCGTETPPCTAPAAPTVSAQAFCPSGTVAQLTATGATGAVFHWYSTETGGTALAAGTALTTGTYYVSQTVDACESIRVGVPVTVTTPAVPTVDSTQQLCPGSLVSDLVAQGTAGGTIQWSLTPNGSALSANTALVAGNYYAKQTVGTCQSDAVTVAVTLAGMAMPTADTTQSFCAGATVADLSATGATGATMQWSLTNGGATLSNSTVLVSGNYFASQVVGQCESAGLSVAVTVNAIPATPTGSATQQFTAGETVASLDISPTSGVIWYVMVNGELTDIPSSTLLTNGTTYYAKRVLSGCESGYFTVTANQSLATASFDLAGLMVYPNPATAVVTVSAGEAIANVRIFNILGQLVLQQSSTGNVIEVNVDRLTAGTYLLQATSETGKHATLRIVKQ